MSEGGSTEAQISVPPGTDFVSVFSLTIANHLK